MTTPDAPLSAEAETKAFRFRFGGTEGATQTWPPMTYWFRAALTIVGVVVGCLVAYQLRAVAVSVLLALFFAIGLEPAVAGMERRGVRRGFGVLIVLLGLLLFLVLFCFLAVPPAVQQFTQLVNNVPGYFTQLTQSNPKINEFIQGEELQKQLSAALGKVPSLLGSSVGQVFGVASAIVSAIFSALTVLVLMIYFQLALPRLRERANQLVGSTPRRALLEEVLAKISGYVVGQLSICFIAGILAFIFLTIIGAPFPALLGLLTGISSAVPLVGATVGAVVVTLVVLTESWQMALGTIAFYIVYQQLENYVIAPRVFARAINLPPAIVFVSVLAGAALAGVLGAIVALPVAAAIKSLWKYRVRTLDEGASGQTDEALPAPA